MRVVLVAMLLTLEGCTKLPSQGGGGADSLKEDARVYELSECLQVRADRIVEAYVYKDKLSLLLSVGFPPKWELLSFSLKEDTLAKESSVELVGIPHIPTTTAIAMGPIPILMFEGGTQRLPVPPTRDLEYFSLGGRGAIAEVKASFPYLAYVVSRSSMGRITRNTVKVGSFRDGTIADLAERDYPSPASVQISAKDAIVYCLITLARECRLLEVRSGTEVRESTVVNEWLDEAKIAIVGDRPLIGYVRDERKRNAFVLVQGEYREEFSFGQECSEWDWAIERDSILIVVRHGWNDVSVLSGWPGRKWEVCKLGKPRRLGPRLFGVGGQLYVVWEDRHLAFIDKLVSN